MKQDKRAIEITVQLLKKHNIRQVVISPGGTNIPFIKMVQKDPFFHCYSVVDERSAIYFAIGLYLRTGEIIATSCTSAQATRNYIPGLTEAFYKRVPILAITMEKLPRFIGQEYMQAPHQCSLPDDSVKKSVELPFIKDVNDEYECIRKVNEALLELTHHGNGPVQLCIPWLDFPISEQAPAIRSIRRRSPMDVNANELEGKKILIVVGEHRKFSQTETKAIDNFTEQFNCAVYVNNLSNFRGKYSIAANLELSAISLDEFAKSYAPDLIISVGGQTGDYPLYTILSKPELKDIEHWRVNEDGKVIDTYDKLTDIFECSILEFFGRFTEVQDSDHSYYDAFKKLCSTTKRDIELPFSSAYVAQTLAPNIPENSVMQFSILNSLRVWNLFPMKQSVECFSNVGAFGIDGGMSTLIGQSVATDDLCYMIIGDLAFYYDMNAIGIRHIKNNLRIILVNNNGGVEFKLWDGDHSEVDKYIAAAGHFKNAEGWANTCGFEYMTASCKEEFDAQYSKLIVQSEKPILFEIFVSDHDDFEGYNTMIQANKNMDAKDYLKKGIKKLIGR